MGYAGICGGLIKCKLRRYWGMVEEDYLIIYPGGVVLREMCTLQWS